ncbi:hypothetical protein PHYBLDRAFT_153597 [Phycomyces blakesleeanus NRRL 1555(-)]|uniref:C2H2-type zinc finger transcription factor n=1 Tax=Phycomyces blakesleeanus (strain ATCC 8743b / DSM 1359 / FGSC 10004 / NBRC 33097 / NRRL 1555) TaxID=763407 RepID=A0A167J730_PHYB8|nr:hypothetical protein PHYBLDRAFT_153597 [Phycomyces blakesleeanus NRRL 1555(-)]OAD65347.1 hypothetical protein PHYBLDRAFT_153597 [Phycomyces blakesleeanus NRRL 1555(-)]|eukprot:XP_018283387.1 hypothetical protein PHYBLDRAFT_153597 [Phycomyces blakesleeanus NRRL 1555(-)]
MSNNRIKNDYVFCQCPECIASSPSGKRQRKQNARQHNKEHGLLVSAANTTDIQNEDIDIEDFIFDNDNADNVNSDDNDNEENTNLESLVIDSNKIEEGNASFDFEQGETLDVDTESSLDCESNLSFVFIVHEFSVNSMPIYIRFVAIFIVISHLIFLVDNCEYILIEFCNNLLSICNLAGSLPLTIDSLRHITGFDEATKGMTVYVTLMVYPYNLLKHALQQKFFKPDFEQRINLWRNRLTIENTKLDIYDGSMWNELQDSNDAMFVDDFQSLMLTLNIDWFQPFDGQTHSSGAIYLSINNLPRSERLKPENIILVGMMPGLKEASTDSMNH